MVRLSNMLLAAFVVLTNLLLNTSVASAASQSSELVDLLNLPLEELTNISVVTASKREQQLSDAPGVITVMSAQEIAQYGANNMVELIERLPGVVPLHGYDFQTNAISIRADLPNQNDTHFLILINGRPFKASFNGTANGVLMKSFPVEIIQRLEFIRGPGSVLYGSNAYSGVLNIITKPGTYQSSVSATAGSWETRRVNFMSGFEEKDAGVQVHLSTFQEDGSPVKFIDEASIENSTEYSEDNQSLTLSGHYKNLRLDLFLANTDETHLGSKVLWPTGIIERDTRFIGLGYDYELNKDWDLHTNLQHTSMTQNYNTPPTPQFDGEAREVGLEVYANGKLNTDTSLLIGVTTTQLSGSISGMAANLDRYELLWSSFYAQFDYKISDDIDLFAGGQFHKAEGIDSAFVPRLGGIYRISSSWSTKLLYAEAFRSPYPAEIGVVAPVVIGNPDLVAETVKTTDLQLIYQVPKLRVSSGIFISKQEDLIVRTPGGGGMPGLFVNTGERKISGLEIELQWRPSTQFSLQSSLTYQHNEDGSGVEDVTLAPDYLFKIGAAYNPRAGVSLALFDNYTDDFKDVIILNPSRTASNPEAGGDHMVTLNASMHIPTLLPELGLPDSRVILFITNLLDEEQYVPEYTRAIVNTLPVTTERAAYLKLTVNF